MSEEIFAKADQIQGWFPKYDMANLFYIASNHIPENGLVVEVGTWKGRSTYVLASVCREKHAKLICIDSFKGLLLKSHVKWDLYHARGGYYEEGNYKSVLPEAKENLKEFGDMIIFLEGDSRKLFKKLKHQSADFIFVDGDHDEPVVSEDFKNFYRKLKVGGYYCGHDFEETNDVGRAIRRLFPFANVELYQTIWGFRKP